MLNTRITKDRLKNHFHYQGWVYVLVIALSIFGWNMVYTVTEPRTPNNMKLDIYVTSGYVDETNGDALSARIKEVFPNKQEINVYSLSLSEEDFNIVQVVQTRVVAQEGDIFFFDQSFFKSWAEMGAFMPLDAAIADGRLKLGDIDLTKTTLQQTASEYEEEPVEYPMEVYGIPCDSLPGLQKYGFQTKNLVMCVMTYTENPDDAITLTQWFLDNFGEE